MRGIRGVIGFGEQSGPTPEIFRKLEGSPVEGQSCVNESGDVWLACSGEIYNQAELRQALTNAGHRFQSDSGGEACLHAYEEYGSDFARHLNGVFALVILDRRARRLLLVRDRLGVKPLYYGIDAGHIRFASELGAILADPGVKREIDPLALNLYFVREVVPAPHTIYRGIRKLLPAELVTVDLSKGHAGVESEIYWKLDFATGRSKPLAELAEELRSLLADAVRSQLPSGHPPGVFLSGGLVSSAILSFVAASAGGPVDTFHIGFEDAGGEERQLAENVAALSKTRHREQMFTRAECFNVHREALASFDEPFGDPSAIAYYLLAREARQQVDVAVSGDGADTMFGGHLSGRDARDIRLACRIPDGLRAAGARMLYRRRRYAALKRLQLPAPTMLATLHDHLFDTESSAVVRREWRVPPGALWESYERLWETIEGLDPLNAYFAGLAAHYLPDNVLPKLDCACSANSLEVRVPLLDYRLAEFSARVPPKLKFTPNRTKGILHAALAPRLPPMGFERSRSASRIPEAYFDALSWRVRLDELRRADSGLEDLIDFSGMARWGPLFTWRVLALATWFCERHGGGLR